VGSYEFADEASEQEEARTGFVYAYRYGDGDHVKVGKTNNLNKRRQALQGAHHNPLVLVDSIEHVDYAEGERYLHKLLETRQVKGVGVGAREHFLVPADELTEAFEETRRYLELELPRRRELPKYEALEAGENMLPATEEMLEVKHRSEEVRATRARWQAQKDRLDDKARQAWQLVIQQQWSERERLDRLIHEADVQEAELATTAKLVIGTAAGIDGIATWKSVRYGNRRFDPEGLKADEPELFDAYRTAFDAARFKRDHPALHEAHLIVKKRREFEWVDEAVPDTDNNTSGIAMPRWRQAIARTTGHRARRRNGNGA
jgi:hypothetical protein